MRTISKSSRLKRIRMVIFDVDGVLTDGGIILAPDGNEIKRFDVHDGTGIKYLQRAGVQTALLSGRRSRATSRRAKELGISHVMQGYKVKLEGLKRILKAAGLRAEEVCFMGDDLPDIPVMRAVGFAAAVANARPEVMRCAHWTSRAGGGHGAARELAEMLLKAQGKWRGVIGRYGLDEGAAGEDV